MMMKNTIFTMIRRSARKDKKGVVLVLMMAFTAIIVASTVSLSTMIGNDVSIIRHIKDMEQARYLAEAGINHALAKMKTEGFLARADFNGVLDTGSYSVAYTTVSGRYLATSTGTTSLGETKTISVEVKDNTPTALLYFSGAGNDVALKVHTNIEDASIIGDLHANHNVNLIVQSHAQLTISGDVSATGEVWEGSQHYDSDNKDTDLYINGVANDAATIYEGAAPITVPVFDYDAYKEEAVASGNY